VFDAEACDSLSVLMQNEHQGSIHVTEDLLD